MPSHSLDPTRQIGRAAAYRPEVDGLRAVAVLAILLFHFKVPGFTGGFVGVDVFFVISGYLITRLILGELEADRFKFGAFYGRRARRLAPAMLATLAATFVAGVAIISPMHLEQLSVSLVYTLLSLSNVLFWRSAGYFDVASELKPLLHTWSLGVEEQFYLVWPISVVLVYRMWRSRGVLILAAIVGLVSLVAAEYAAGRHTNAAYFLTPFRMCEFALGALCLWLAVPRETRPFWRDTLTLLGLVAIGYSVASYTPTHRFPGLSAMVPCVGAAMIIVSGRGRLAAVLLANRLAVGVGLISYSLYLVHWPLVTFWRYGQSEPLTPMAQTTLMAVSIILATAMYFGVEKPFRANRSRTKRLSDPAFGLACAGLGFGLVLPAVAALAANGWPSRTPQELRKAAAMIPTGEQREREAPLPKPGAMPAGPLQSGRTGVIIGDSHAGELLTILTNAGSQVNYEFLHIQYFCQPIFGDRPYGDGSEIKSREIAEDCRRQGEALKTDPRLQTADLILFASTWRDFGLAALPATIDYLKAHDRGRIVILGGRFFFTDPSALLSQVSSAQEANRRFDAAKDVDANASMVASLKTTADKAGVSFVDLRPYVCDRTADGWFCPLLLEDGTPLYVDWHHWTDAAKKQVGTKLRADGQYGFLF